MSYLRRLATTGAAYTASSIVSKLIAVVLLPIYTAYLTPADYGAAEVMLASVIAGSIVIRFGVIEAILRFYYLAGERPERVVATGFASLAWTSTIAATIALAFAEPISEALLDRPDAGLARLAILGLWSLTLWEFVLTMLRLDERARAYFAITVINVLVTIPTTVYLVVVRDMGAEGILLGTFGTGLFFLAYRLWEEHRRLSLRPDLPLLRRMLRFGLPTMPAELTLYSLNFVDRIIIVRLAGLAEAGLYALAVKFANGLQVLARGFQLAFPPLAYSIRDDDEARRTYALLVTWFAAVLAFAVVGLWLLARWLLRALAADEFFGAYEVVGPLAAGIALYALYLAMVVVLGRTGRTEFGLPATVAAVVVNIGLNLWLVPEKGIVGAAIALVASYVVVLVLMYAVSQRLFRVPYEWRRLGLVLIASAGLVAGGDLLLPTDGLDGFALRLAAWFAFPMVLLVGGFLSREERAEIRRWMEPGAVRARLAELRSASGSGEGMGAGEAAERRSSGAAPETFEQAQRDSDRPI
ncbi:MAG: lipopolysaccharide biosynthesis protein [Solirubrobacterales bacterium]